MTGEERDRIFDAYHSQSMTPEERSAFAQRLEAEPELREAYAEYLTLISAIGAHGRDTLKAEISETMDSTTADTYQPGGNGGGGFKFPFNTIFGLLILGGLVFGALIYSGKVEVDNPTINNWNEQLHEFEERVFQKVVTDTIYDTVYHYYYEDEVVEEGQ